MISVWGDMFAGLPHNQHVEWASVRNSSASERRRRERRARKSSRRDPAPVVASTDAASLERARARGQERQFRSRPFARPVSRESDVIAPQIKKTNISEAEFRPILQEFVYEVGG